MKRIILSLLVLAIAAGGALAQAPVVDPGWSAFIIREANDGTSGPPLMLDNDVYEENAIEMVVFAGGQKAGLGTDMINGATVGQIATLHVDRLDDFLNSDSLYGPYFNIWVTDGLGHYAVIANEPSNGAWVADRWDVPDWDFLSTKVCKVYETPDAAAGTSWVHDHAQLNGWSGVVGELTFAHVAALAIEPPSPAYIADGANLVGTGAPRVLGTNVAYGYNWMFGDSLENYVSGDEGFVVNNYTATAPLAVQNITLGTSYPTIEGALAEALTGNVITIDDGVYNPPGTLSITVPLTLSGALGGGVTINIPAAGGYGFSVAADDVTLENFNVVAHVDNQQYPFHISGTTNLPDGFDNLTMNNITVSGVHRRAGLDIHGYNNVVLSNISSEDATGGNGIQLTGVVGATLENITTANNAWGSIAIYCSQYMPRASSDIEIDGATLSVGEDYVFSQDEFGLINADYAVTGYEYHVRNSHFREAIGASDSEGYTILRDDLAAATGFALGLTGYEQYSTIMDVASGDWVVIDGMSIQAAIDAADPGDLIDVAAGTYVEALLIAKELTVQGATAGVNKNGYAVPAGYLWDDAVESVIQHPGGTYVAIVDIHDANNVVFDGFVVEELNAVANTNTSLVRVYAEAGEITNINVVNNVIGPNTNVTLQDGAQGRMGLYIVNHPYGDQGVVNSTFAGNKIFDCKGNGDNIFLWSSYYAYGAPGPADMTGTVIEDNEIYGSHRAGIETAGGYANLTIRNNTIYGQTGLPGDDPDFLKYGHGIQLIRGSSDKVSDPLTAYGPVNLTVEGNEIFGNQKCGIYMGPKNTDINITGNVIHDNGWNGIMLDLEGNYWNPQFESPPLSGDYACFDCSENVTVTANEIFDNGNGGNLLAHHGIQIVGVPTNAFQIGAESNWWGSATGPLDASDDTATGGLYNPGGLGDEVTDLVLYGSWSGIADCLIDPDVSGPLNCSQTASLVFGFDADIYTPDVFLYNAVVSATAGLDFGPVYDLEPFGSINNTFFAMQTGASQWTITGSTVGAPTYPITGEGTTNLFSIVFSAAGDVSGTVVFESLTLRDPDNVTIPVVVAGATIEYDCTAPAAVTAIVAAPGHNKIDVDWAHDGLDVDHYEVFSGLWYDTAVGTSAYPEYDDLANDIVPTIPADYQEAFDSDEWTPLTDALVTNQTQSWSDHLSRGVYYYTVFAVDAAGNPSAAPAALDRATNYWLGDVDQAPGASTPDGEVDPFDMNVLGTYFGSAVPIGHAGAVADVGPTDDWSRLGIPNTDSVVNFEDLMIFAMNFGIVSGAKSKVPVAKTVDLAWVHYDDGSTALRLVDGAGLKGLRVTADVAIPGVTTGQLLDEQSELTFLQNVGEKLDASVAVMGLNNTFTGTGDLLVVSGGAEIALDKLTITARAIDNSELEIRLDQTSGILTPRVFALQDNYPNPFNPQTKISFSLPESQHVQLTIFGVDGRKVATLLNEVRGVGLHEVTWSGRDGSDKGVASGTYFFRLEAGPYSDVKKMTLMK
jgi:Right handed beta helix region